MPCTSRRFVSDSACRASGYLAFLFGFRCLLLVNKNTHKDARETHCVRTNWNLSFALVKGGSIIQCIISRMNSGKSSRNVFGQFCRFFVRQEESSARFRCMFETCRQHILLWAEEPDWLVSSFVRTRGPKVEQQKSERGFVTFFCRLGAPSMLHFKIHHMYMYMYS